MAFVTFAASMRDTPDGGHGNNTSNDRAAPALS